MKKLSVVLVCILMISCRGSKKETRQYSIDQFFKTVSIGGTMDFSSDDSGLLFSTNETGIYNVFELNLENGTKRQITSSDSESCFSLGYVRGTKQILFSADKGGNEITHLYLLDENNTSIDSATDLTPGEKVKANFNGWSKDRKTLFFSSNERDPQYFDLYKMNTGDWKKELIFKNTDGYDLTVGTKDGSIIALTKPVTTSESRLFILNTENSNIKEISEPDKPAAYNASAFSDDNQFFYFTTDAGKEFTYGVRYNIQDGNREILYETNWDVVGIYFSENMKYRLLVVNEDGKLNVKITDNEKGTEIKYPEIPGSNVTGLAISESEKVMALLLGNSKSPGDLYIYNFGTGELKKMMSTMNPEIDEKDLVDATVVRFKSFDSLNIPAIYYKPLDASVRNKVPALIFVHGGPGGQSMLYYDPLTQYLVNHGYAILAVNNRGSSGYGKTFFRMDDRDHGGKDLMDCIYGKKWLQQQNYIDSARIGIIGGSYGGFMTMAAMTFHPDEFKAGVNFFGVTNWIRTLKSIPPFWGSFRDALYQEMGNPFTSDSVMLYNISPLFHASEVRNPVMVLQGANDPRVLKIESDEMVEAIKANNVAVEYVIFPDEGHGFVKKQNEIKADSGVLSFLNKYLRADGSEISQKTKK
jgi:dipeptidyl aminopeptidase/acylaminoacyl peptidase